MRDNDWMSRLNRTKRAAATRQIELLAKAGVIEPEIWVRSEVEEDLAQVARAILLRRVWREAIDAWVTTPGWVETSVADATTDPDGMFADAGLAMRRMLDLGVDAADIGRLARAVAYGAAYAVVQTIDDGHDPVVAAPGAPDAPSWALIETRGDRLTGRALGALHQDLLAADPTGREGRPAGEPQEDAR
jgi:hypothetical protein